MTTPRRTARQGSRSDSPQRSHARAKAECLKFVRHLSDFLDQELAEQLCEHINRHAEHCPPCDHFLATLRKTVALCRHAKVKPLSSSLKAQLRRDILQAAVRGRSKK